MFKPQPMHITRAVQQAYGIDHPIGDPFGGAAYGELNGGGSVGKVLSSVIPMVAGAVMMLTPAAPMGAMLLGGAMFAGGALNGIGQLTGNQDLVKIGGITSAVAGVASMGYGLYTNWDSITGAVGGFLENGATATTELGGATTGALETGGAALNTVNAPSVAADIVNSGSNFAPTVSGAFQASNAAPIATSGSLLGPGGSTIPGVTSGTSFATPSSLLSSGSGANAISGTNALTSIPGITSGSALNPTAGSGFGLDQLLGKGGSTIPGVTSGTSFQMPSSLLGQNASTVSGVTGAPTGTGVSSNLLQNFKYTSPLVTPPPSDGGGLLSSVGNFINKNPVVSLMGLQTVAGLAEGASPKSQAEGEYLQAMAQLKEAETNYINSGKSKEAEDAFYRAKAYEQEKRNAYNLSIMQMTAPNVAAATATYNPSGIINQARA